MPEPADGVTPGLALLSRAKRPMQVQELITKVLETPGVELKGKTPRATVAAQLYTGKEFQKAGRGIVKFAAAATDTEKVEPTSKPKSKRVRMTQKEREGRAAWATKSRRPKAKDAEPDADEKAVVPA